MKSFVPNMKMFGDEQFKRLNSRLCNVLVHAGKAFLFSQDGIYGLAETTNHFPKRKFIINDVEIQPDILDLHNDTVISGRGFAWQDGGKYYFYVQPLDIKGDSTGNIVLIAFKLYK